MRCKENANVISSPNIHWATQNTAILACQENKEKRAAERAAAAAAMAEHEAEVRLWCIVWSHDIIIRGKTLSVSNEPIHARSVW